MAEPRHLVWMGKDGDRKQVPSDLINEYQAKGWIQVIDPKKMKSRKGM